MFTEMAYAMAPGGGGEGGAGGYSGIIMIVVMFAIFYFLLIRPQQKKQKDHRNMISNLKKGDRVITSGGIYGEITGVKENDIVIEIAPKIRIKVARGYIAGTASPAQAQSGDMTGDK